MSPTLITGNDDANTLLGGAGDDIIYGFDPNGPQAQVSTIAATRVASGIVGTPLFAAAPPGDLDRLFIVTKSGLIRILDLDTGALLPTPFLDVSAQIDTVGERGLLGLAFDPDFATNGYFYVNLINKTGLDTEIRRYHVSASNPNQADVASMTPVMTIDQTTASNHKAGWLGFGPDGYLYAALGDGGPGNDPSNNAQNPNVLLGKILRLDVDGDDFPGDASRNYAVPADNPFIATSPADEIFALGLRNPWRPSFDRALGTFYIADVGQSAWEEIDIGAAGANYGWRVYEGPDQHTTETPTAGTLTFPIHAYDRTVGHSITGGYVYRGESEGLQGQYFFADFSLAKLFTLNFDGVSWQAVDRTSQLVEDAGSVSAPTSFGEDGRGNLYVVDGDGEVFRLTPLVASADQADVLSGGAGRDMLFGGSGDDVLIGGPDADFLTGGPGTDTASYESAAAGVVVWLDKVGANTGDAAGDTYVSIETLHGSSFRDLLVGDNAANMFDGLDGHDSLYGFGGADEIFGGQGNDYLYGGAGGDHLEGGAGFDYARYDTALAGVTVDLAAIVTGTNDAAGDTFVDIEGVVGSPFDDALYGDEHGNVLQGRGGNDTLEGRASPDTLDGGPGTDVASYASALAGVFASLASPAANTGDAAGDTYVSIENLDGSSLRDTLIGDGAANDVRGQGGNDSQYGLAGGDTLRGGAGNDYLYGGADGDVLDGGADNDFARYDGSAGVTVDLQGTNSNTGEADGDSYIDIESVVGSGFVDNLFGDDNANELQGRGGSDTLDGRGGNDTLNGGAASDSLTGGAGNDSFLFSRGEAMGDSLVDFDGQGAAVGDRLVFSGYGAGATFERVVGVIWSINSGDGTTHDLITFLNAASPDASDYTFV